MGYHIDDENSFERLTVPTIQQLLARAFERCSNYPDTPDGIAGLVEGMSEASTRYDVTPEEIISECRQSSAFCPTDRDILNVARDMWEKKQRDSESRRNQEQEWRKQYGPPKPFEWTAADSAAAKQTHRRREKMWRELKLELKVEGGKWPGWHVLAAAARKLGYTEYADAWDRSSR